MANVVTLIEGLTRKVRNFGAAPGVLLTFGTFEPGIYTLINSSASNITVVLFGQSFVVPPHSRWMFMAHGELESFRWEKGAPAVGRQRVSDGTEAVPTDFANVEPPIPIPEPTEEGVV